MTLLVNFSNDSWARFNLRKVIHKWEALKYSTTILFVFHSQHFSYIQKAIVKHYRGPYIFLYVGKSPRAHLLDDVNIMIMRAHTHTHAQWKCTIFIIMFALELPLRDLNGSPQTLYSLNRTEYSAYHKKPPLLSLL